MSIIPTYKYCLLSGLKYPDLDKLDLCPSCDVMDAIVYQSPRKDTNSNFPVV